MDRDAEAMLRSVQDWQEAREVLTEMMGLAEEFARLAGVVCEIAGRGADVSVRGLRDGVHLGDGRVLHEGEVVRVNRFVADLLMEKEMAEPS